MNVAMEHWENKGAAKPAISWVVRDSISENEMPKLGVKDLEEIKPG